MDSRLEVLPRMRASPEQFAALIDFMERHGDLSRPQAGPQGRLRADRMWSELTNILNSFGSGIRKSEEKWKKVWADWKTKTKKKKLLIRQHASGTGGGPSSRQSLTTLEERILTILGMSAVVGQSGIQEHGFNRPSEPNEPPSQNEPSSQQNEPTSQQNDQGTGGTPKIVLVVSRATAIAPELEAPPPQSSSRFSPTVLTQFPVTSLSTFSSSPRLSFPPPLPQLRQCLPPPPQLCRLRTPQSPRSSQPGPKALPPPPSPRPTPPPPEPTPSSPQLHPPPVSPFPQSPVRRSQQQTSAAQCNSPRRQLNFGAARRNRGDTPFDRAAKAFSAIEQRRLELEETRDRRLHEREIERLRLESHRIEVSRQQNELLQQLNVVVQTLLDVMQKRPTEEPM